MKWITYVRTTTSSDLTSCVEFKTEMVAVLPLYDVHHNCIVKNRAYPLELLQLEEQKKPLPTKYETFKPNHAASNLKSSPNGEKLLINLRLISNEFTHNTYINNLLLLKDTNSHDKGRIEYILKNLKNLKESNDQIVFHDKILDKLFQLMSSN